MKVKKWLLALAAFAAMAVLCVVCAGAETYGDLEYSVLGDGTVEITDYNGSAEKVDIPAEIDGKSVTSIGDWAFSGCDSLTNITIPNSVTGIGGSAFEECTSLTSITIPDSVTWISDSAFSSCTSLTSITIPDSVTQIGDYVFLGCTNLIEIEVETGNKGYSSDNGVLFNKNKTEIICYPAGIKDTKYLIPSSVTSIGKRAFQDCSNLTNIKIPDRVSYIDSMAFVGCTSLTAINVETENQNHVSVNGVLYNKDKTTLECYPAGKKDKNYEILDGVTNIYMFAFSDCVNLISITIPDSIVSIDSWVFSGCTNLAEIKVSNVNPNYISVNGVLYNKNKTTIVWYPTGKKDKNYRILDGVTNINEYAFRECINLTSIIIPVTVTEIGRSAFVGCSSLMNVTIPDNVIVINKCAFGYYYDYDTSKMTKNNNFKIYCYIGTAGEQYAKDNSFAYELLDKPTLAKVTGVKLGGRAADALRINWSKNTSADGYIVEMYQGNKWVRAAKITSNSTTTFRKAGLKASSVYKFRVRAYKMSGKTALYGNYSATVTARTSPSIVKGVKIGGKAKDALRVNWTKNASAQGYIVEMYKGGKWVRVAKITKNSTNTYRKAGLAKNTTYKFRVKAYYMSGKTALYGNYGSVSGKTAAK